MEENGGWVVFVKGDRATYPIEYGKYEVFRAGCMKQHYETWNNTFWAYNGNDITHYRKIMSPMDFGLENPRKITSE